MLTRRIFLSVFVALGIAAASPAQAANGPADAQLFVETLANNAISTMAGATVSDEQRNAEFRRMFVTAFDLPKIGKLVLGRYWLKATEPERQEFLALFEDVTVLIWAGRFRDYSNERLEVVGVQPDGESGYVVQSRIVREQGQPIPVNWVLRSGDGEFKVIDIVVEGVSLAITHRQEYASVLASSGGRVAALNNALRNKVAQLREHASAAAN